MAPSCGIHVAVPGGIHRTFCVMLHDSYYTLQNIGRKETAPLRCERVSVRDVFYADTSDGITCKVEVGEACHGS